MGYWTDVAGTLDRPAVFEPAKKRMHVARDLHVDALETGHVTVDEIRRNLAVFDELPYFRSFDQVRMHEMMLSCMGRYIYGAAFYQNEMQIMRRNRWKDLGRACAVQTPRRWGKTEATAMFACALALSCPGIKISIFASGGRAAGGVDGLLAKIKQKLIDVFGLAENIIKSDDEHLFIKIGDSVREIRAYPAGKDAYVVSPRPLPPPSMKDSPHWPSVSARSRKGSTPAHMSMQKASGPSASSIASRASTWNHSCAA
jgi:hypothetical protein